MNKIISFCLVSLVLVSCSPYKKYAATAAAWEKEISALERLDQSEKYSKDAVLFIGSSSIRLWKNMQEDMAPYEPIRRGYGGAKFSDLIHFTERLVYPHDFQALCIFVANDITGNEKDLSVKETMKLFKEVVHTVRKKYPDVPVFQIAVTPNSSRWKVWPEIQDLNALFRKYCESHKNMYFIDPSVRYLNEKGIPRDELFVSDKLHQNQAGYNIWAEEIKKELNKVLKK
jgi:hypothetical protein